MLILGRLLNEQIVLKMGGESVTITLLDVRGGGGNGGSARIGIDAPRSVKIVRAELLEGDSDESARSA